MKLKSGLGASNNYVRIVVGGIGWSILLFGEQVSVDKMSALGWCGQVAYVVIVCFI